MTTDADVLGFLSAFTAEKGYPPTVREIARGVGLASASAALHHLTRLEKQGVIERGKGSARTIRVVNRV